MLEDFQCRSCESRRGELTLELGEQPLANNLLNPEDLSLPEPCFPLRLVVCADCWLLQITDLVPPVELFSDYIYFSSYSDAWVKHAAECAARYREEFAPSYVIEIASNDGYLLRYFAESATPHLGIELAGSPTGVADSEHGPVRALAEGDGPQGHGVRGDGDVRVHRDGVGELLLGRVHQESAFGLNRPPVVDSNLGRRLGSVEAEALDEDGQFHPAEDTVDHQAESARVIVSENQDDGSMEVRHEKIQGLRDDLQKIVEENQK